MNGPRLLSFFLALLLAACGDDAPPVEKPPSQDPATPGIYELDPKATLERMKLAGDKTKTLEEVAAVQVRLELKRDGTFESRTVADKVQYAASGTWETNLEAITLKTLVVNDHKLDKPDEKTGSYHDGALWMDSSENSQPVVLRRK